MLRPVLRSFCLFNLQKECCTKQVNTLLCCCFPHLTSFPLACFPCLLSQGEMPELPCRTRHPSGMLPAMLGDHFGAMLLLTSLHSEADCIQSSSQAVTFLYFLGITAWHLGKEGEVRMMKPAPWRDQQVKAMRLMPRKKQGFLLEQRAWG